MHTHRLTHRQTAILVRGTSGPCRCFAPPLRFELALKGSINSLSTPLHRITSFRILRSGPVPGLRAFAPSVVRSVIPLSRLSRVASISSVFRYYASLLSAFSNVTPCRRFAPPLRFRPASFHQRSVCAPLRLRTAPFVSTPLSFPSSLLPLSPLHFSSASPSLILPHLFVSSRLYSNTRSPLHFIPFFLHPALPSLNLAYTPRFLFF